MALGDYHGLDMPRLTDVVEKAVEKRSGNAKASFAGIGGGAELGKDVELQSSFTIAPTEKASVSKVIDGLLAGDHTVPVSEEAVLKKDDIVEIEGLVRLTAASLAGKMLYILRKYLESTDQDIRDLNFRRQHLDRHKHEAELVSRLRDRYTTSAAQLGSHSATVRLGHV